MSASKFIEYRHDFEKYLTGQPIKVLKDLLLKKTGISQDEKLKKSELIKKIMISDLLIFRIVKYQSDDLIEFPNVKILNQVHPSNKMGSDSNELINIILNTLIFKIRKLQENKKLSIKEQREFIINAIFTGDLAKNAFEGGNKAFEAIENSKEKIKIVFDSKKLNLEDAVFWSAILEYITSEILKLAGEVTFEFHKIIIKDYHIEFALSGDEELKKFINNLF